MSPSRLNGTVSTASHIFAEAMRGYSSYRMAEVLSADCYAAFEEAGDPFDAQPPGGASSKRSLSAALARRSKNSAPSAGAIRAWMRCCGHGGMISG